VDDEEGPLIKVAYRRLDRPMSTEKGINLFWRAKA
jgi:hypothetical protein